MGQCKKKCTSKMIQKALERHNKQLHNTRNLVEPGGEKPSPSQMNKERKKYQVRRITANHNHRRTHTPYQSGSVRRNTKRGRGKECASETCQHSPIESLGSWPKLQSSMSNQKHWKNTHRIQPGRGFHGHYLVNGILYVIQHSKRYSTMSDSEMVVLIFFWYWAILHKKIRFIKNLFLWWGERDRSGKPL